LTSLARVGPECEHPIMDQHELERDERRPAEEADAVRVTRLERDLSLSPSQRLDKLAALCAQASVLRDAQRLR
jgi:hypothetical protein